MDYYQILGVDPSSTPRQIKAAYRQLAFRYHPDRAAEANHPADTGRGPERPSQAGLLAGAWERGASSARTGVHGPHPEGGGSQARMQQINEAYAVLGDPWKRLQYDYNRQYYLTLPRILLRGNLRGSLVQSGWVYPQFRLLGGSSKPGQ